MRICYVGGNEPLLIRLMEYMAGRGHKIHWISLGYPQYEIDNVVIHNKLSFFNTNYKKRNTFLPYYFFLFKSIVNRISPDLIHAVNVKWAGWFSVLFKSRPVVVTTQGSDVMLRESVDRDIIRMYLKNFVIKRADVVTYGSKKMLEDILYWAQPMNTLQYFSGVNFNQFDWIKTNSSLKEKLGLSRKNVVFSPRGFVPNSNLDIIIRSIPRVIIDRPDTIFVFGNHYGTVDYKESILDLAKRLDVIDHCLFLGHIPLHDMAAHYSISDVVVSILSSDGMPSTLLEAMAMKKPLVISDIPTYLELMDNDYALIVKPRSVTLTAEAIIKALSCDEEVEKIVRISYDWVKSNADRNRLDERLEKLYNNIIGLLPVIQNES